MFAQNWCSFHLNDHTRGFHPQTQKLEPLFRKTTAFSLAVKGLRGLWTALITVEHLYTRKINFFVRGPLRLYQILSNIGLVLSKQFETNDKLRTPWRVDPLPVNEAS